MGHEQKAGHNINPQIINQAIISPDNDGHKAKLKVLTQPNIGLESDVRQLVIKILNTSLADEAVLSQKTRSAYWNVRGTGFLELHILFETQYQQLNEITDRIAERASMLGGIAIASFKEFLAHTHIEEETQVVPDNLHLLADHEKVIRFLREDIRKCNEEYEDEGTVDLMIGVMSLHEKMAWMLRAYIENETVKGESQKRKLNNE